MHVRPATPGPADGSPAECLASAPPTHGRRRRAGCRERPRGDPRRSWRYGQRGRRNHPEQHEPTGEWRGGLSSSAEASRAGGRAAQSALPPTSPARPLVLGREHDDFVAACGPPARGVRCDPGDAAHAVRKPLIRRDEDAHRLQLGRLRARAAGSCVSPTCSPQLPPAWPRPPPTSHVRGRPRPQR